jgi:hypothetical protein
LWLLDESRGLQYNKESIFVSPAGEAAVEAVLHRPLRQCLPWRFSNMPNISEHAFEETNNQCVPYQLSQCLKLYGGQEAYNEEQIMSELEKDIKTIYEDNFDNPYVSQTEKGIVQHNPREYGITPAVLINFCKRKRISCHILWKGKKIESHVPVNTEHRTIALYVWGDHAFFIEDNPKVKEHIAKMEQQIPKSMSEDVVEPLLNTVSGPDASTWQPWNGQIVSSAHAPKALQPGHFYSYDLQSARVDLHKESICPYVVLDGTSQPKHLIYNDLHIHSFPEEAKLCMRFAGIYKNVTKRDLKYHGQKYGQFTLQALNEMGKRFRVKPMKEEKQFIIQRQGNKCATCDAPFSNEFNIDHIVPLSAGGTNDHENLHAICINCHTLKTTQEVQSFLDDGSCLASMFSKETWKEFVMSQKPFQLVANIHEPKNGPVLNVDIIRSRFNGLVENQEDIPVYCPMDDIVTAIPGELADYTFVDLGNVRYPRMVLPYWGRGWYFKSSCKYFLDHDIASWPNFKFSFNASAHQPATFLSHKLQTINDIWLQAAHSEQDPAFVAKLAINMAFGIMSIKEKKRYHCVVSSHPDDGPANSTHQPTPGSPYENDKSVFHDIICAQNVHTLTSMMPVHRFCLENERLRVAQALFIIEKHCSVQRLISIENDGIFLQCPKSKLPGLKRALELSYKDLPNLMDLYNQRPSKQRRISKDASIWVKSQTPSQSTQIVYKVREKDEARLPGGELTIEDTQYPNIPDLVWNTLEENSDVSSAHAPQAHQFVEETILPHILAGNSCFISGGPGVGKSFTLNRIYVALTEAGHNVYRISFTHVAARNIGGQTAHSFAMRYIVNGALPKNSIVLCDEISMLPAPLIAALEQLRLNNVRILSFGDFDQLLPISNCFKGSVIPESKFMHSRLFKQWSDETCFVLKKCRRSDEAHFNFYMQIPRMSLQDAITQSLDRFKQTEQPCEWNLVISHHRRKHINATQQARLAKNKFTVSIPPGPDPGFELFCGTKLLGCNNSHKIIRNGSLYGVIKVLPFKCIVLEDQDTGETFEVDPIQIAKHTRIAYACTFPSVQGRTLKGSVCIWDYNSKHFNNRHLYIGISRATNGSLVYMGK